MGTRTQSSYSWKKNKVSPSDAVILFDGTNVEAWERSKEDSSKVKWNIEEGIRVVKTGAGGWTPFL